jgi:uncharacterized protein YprB with RNaseH-like and TPR domain
MTLSKKLEQQQLLKTRNETRFSSLPVTATDNSASGLPPSEPSTIESGLEKLRRRFRTPPRDQERSSVSVSAQPHGTFAGDLKGDDADAFLRRVSHSPFGLDDQQEAVSIRHLIQLLCANVETADPRSVIFLDTETTGLSGGAGTVAFLVGVGRWSGSGFTVEQYLMRDYNEERAMLLGLRESLADAQVLVTFNGKAFDIPLLQSRFVLTRQRWPLAGVVHLDLLHPARRIWKLRLGSCSLANLESQILGIERQNDIPGHLIPQVYFRYVRTRTAHGIGNILSHNRQDIETLARLTLRMGEIFSGQVSEELAPVDLFSAGKFAHALGQRELAVRWNEAALMRGLPDGHEVEAKKAKAARLKVQKKYSEAAELWRDLSLRSEVFLEDVHEELAIYYEHREGNLEEALSLSELALEQLQDRATLKKWEHRRARVAMKLARRTLAGPGLLFRPRN